MPSSLSELAPTLTQALVVVVGLIAGQLWPREKRPGFFSKESFTNVLNAAFLFPIRIVIGITGAAALDMGFINLTGLPVAVQGLIAFLVIDFVRYWVHFADHRVPILWSFHRVHHSAEELDATTGFRMHIVDFLQLSALPIVLFGLIFKLSPGWALPGALMVGIVADAIEHSNVRFTLDSPFRRAWFQVFNTPLFHSWHHTRDGAICDGNYANALPLWDRLFGTDVTRPEPPVLYGLEDKQALASDLIGLQLLKPGERQRATSAG